MSSLSLVSSSSSPRFGGRLPLVASMALVFTAGTFPLGAQQVVELRRAPRAEPGDSVDRQLRRLQLQLDSLTRNYTERGDLTAAERQRLATEMSRTVGRWVELNTRLGDDAAPRADVVIRMTPMGERAAASSMARTFAQMTETEAAAPKGWIGMVVEGVGLPPRLEHGEFFVRYLSYPRIESVDPSSPAQRAGIAPNDTLVAYDGRDVRNEISMTALLRPNALIKVKVRRDGMLREIPVTVAAVPSRIVQRRGDEIRDAREGAIAIQDGPSFFPETPRPSVAPSAPVRVGARMTMPAIPPQASQAPVATPTPPFVFMVTGVAGASLVAIDEGLAKVTGIGSGVLVTSAPVGSPANESGLKSGDVIVNVAGQAVKTVTEVRRLVANASDNGAHSVELEIIRDHKSQKISLRW